MKIFTICCDATGCYAQISIKDMSKANEFLENHEHDYYSIYREEEEE